MTAPSKPLPCLNWLDPDAVRAWVKDVDDLFDDLVDMAKDQVAAPSKRIYGRAGARAKIKEFTRGLREQLAYAKRGLEESPK